MVKLKMLKSIRLSRGLSLEQFSRLIGCSGQTIRNWERGRNKPSPLAEDKIDLFLEHLDNARNGKEVKK
jgi:DNA-binding transcriptional regulator YiaG